MMLPTFLNECLILQALVGQVDYQKRFGGYSCPLVYFRCILDSRLGFLQLEGMRV